MLCFAGLSFCALFYSLILFVFTLTVPTIATLEQICDTLGVTLSQFFADGDVVEMTEDLEEFYSAWLALSPDKRKNVLETMKLMK